jgi:hypothetical protein
MTIIIPAEASGQKPGSNLDSSGCLNDETNVQRHVRLGLSWERYFLLE